MNVHPGITLFLLFIACAGCEPQGFDPQEAAWQRVFAEDEAYLKKHERVVSMARLSGGEVTAVRGEPQAGSASFSLSIDFSDKSDVDDSALVELLDGSPVKLFLRGTGVTDAGLAELRSDPGIELLDVSGTSVSDVGIEHIATLTSLKTLSLGNTQVSDEGMAVLNKLVSLEQLSLPENEITDEGVAALRSLHNLRSLNLHHTGVTDAVVAHLSIIMSLENVWLSGTEVTPAGVAILKQSLPQCRIHLDRQ